MSLHILSVSERCTNTHGTQTVFEVAAARQTPIYNVYEHGFRTGHLLFTANTTPELSG